jgi:hypothetical protein
LRSRAGGKGEVLLEEAASVGSRLSLHEPARVNGVSGVSGRDMGREGDDWKRRGLPKSVAGESGTASRGVLGR